ncbi:MAG: hypothetical protein QXH03_11385 [Candidatus Bathyarchaeia archaeon]
MRGIGALASTRQFGSEWITYKASDGSLWKYLGDKGIGGCEVCDAEPVWRWACVEGRWKGAVCVACSSEHAIEAIEGFINYGK